MDARQAWEKNKSDEIARLRALNSELLAACKTVEAWRNGPEGPEVLFGEGAKMLSAIRAAIAKCESEPPVPATLKGKQ